MANKRHLLSYLAGVFDGEGCVRIYKDPPERPNQHSPKYGVSINLNMADEVIPKLFHNTYGGSIRVVKPRIPGHKTQLSWVMSGHCCLSMLKELLPYVLIKRPQFEVAIHLLESTYKNSHFQKLTDEELALREVDFILCRALKKV